jgi:hypothetical protein
MADQTTNHAENKEVSESPAAKQAEAPKAPSQVDAADRGKIAEALATEGVEEEGDGIESGEIRETVSEGGEVKGEGKPATKKDDKKQKKDDGKAGSASFTFDEKNLPPAPDMIRKIELTLRSEIKELEKERKKYQGNLFRKPDYPKLSETVSKIRRKEVLLKRLVGMAYDAVKKLFIQMFSPKKAT